MHYFGGHQVGRTFVIDREALLRQLRQQHQCGNFEHEQHHRIRVSEELERQRKTSVVSTK